MDRLGTKRGLTITVLSYSIVSILTPLARGFYSFLSFRFLLGAGESGNWPGAAKAVSEWFPKHERGLATALFDSGSSIGGAIATRAIMADLRAGAGVTGGPAPFARADRSRFLQALDEALVRLAK